LLDLYCVSRSERISGNYIIHKLKAADTLRSFNEKTIEMKKSFFLIFLGAAVNLLAQDLSNFTFLKSSGNLPADFTTLSMDKYAEDKAANNEKSLDADFFLSTRFLIDELLLSGKVLFNEPLSNYLNKVAKYTLQHEDGLYDQLRFYILKSNVVNAFSSDQGIIIFTTGLLGQLENEAQLAYIIAHEASHFTEKHVQANYIEKQRMVSGDYRRIGAQSPIDQFINYQKEQELEADRKGIDIYMKSEYLVDEIFSGFEMLLYSYLPFEDIQFDTAFFNSEFMRIPSSFFLDSINEVSKEVDYDDKFHTHPNIEKRIDAAIEIIVDRETKGDLKFKISEKEFKQVRELARFESVNIALADREYARALYTIFLLKRDHPENRFLDLGMVKALYGLAKYKNANRYKEVIEKLSDVEGERFKLNLFLDLLSRQQLTVVAFRIATDMAKKYEGDLVFSTYRDNLLNELAIRSKFNPNDLKDISFEESQVDVIDTLNVYDFDVEDSIAKIEASDLSKYQKIKRKKELRNPTSAEDRENAVSENFHLYALYDLVLEGDLIRKLKQVNDDYESEQQLALRYNSNENWSKSESLGIDKLVVVDPLYETIKRNKKNYVLSEQKKMSLGEAFSADYPSLNMEVDLLDSKTLRDVDVDHYTEIGQLYNYVGELLAHGDIPDMITSSHDQMSEFETKYETSHFLFSGVYAVKERKQGTWVHFLGVILVYPLPLVILDLVIPRKHFDLVAFSVNIKDDEIEYVHANQVNFADTKATVGAFVYDVLHELNKKN